MPLSSVGTKLEDNAIIPKGFNVSRKIIYSHRSIPPDASGGVVEIYCPDIYVWDFLFFCLASAENLFRLKPITDAIYPELKFGAIDKKFRLTVPCNLLICLIRDSDNFFKHKFE